MILVFASCKKDPVETHEGEKVRVSCTVSLSDDGKSDFTNLMENGSVNWSEGRECIYVAIPGETPKIIELEGWADGNPSKLEFEGEAAKDLITDGTEYDIWYFGHSQQLDEPFVELTGNTLTGSIAKQSGRLADLGYCHIAKTKVTAETIDGEVVLNLNGTLQNQIAIALLDLENVTELYGDAIVGTEYTLTYNSDADKFELDVTEDNDAKISVESAAGISYVVLLPNEEKEKTIRNRQGDNTYAYTFHNGIKANKIYYRTATDGTTAEALAWEYDPYNGYEYVDLGLPSGLKWATCNVGASSPEEYGNYYAWGETQPAPGFNYIESNCATYGLSISELQSQGYIDNEGNLTSSHDAATANWGGSWRMPTKAEQQELRDNCTWIWTAQNGVNGYKVTGPNGSCIFLPAAGYRYGSSLYLDGGLGNYWSSTPDDDAYDNSAYYLYFFTGSEYVGWDGIRHVGLTVRPLTE